MHDVPSAPVIFKLSAAEWSDWDVSAIHFGRCPATQGFSESDTISAEKMKAVDPRHQGREWLPAVLYVILAKANLDNFFTNV